MKKEFVSSKIIKNESLQITSNSINIREYTIILEDNIINISIAMWSAFGADCTDNFFLKKEIFENHISNKFIKVNKDQLLKNSTNKNINYNSIIFLLEKQKELVWINMSKSSQSLLKKILDALNKIYKNKIDIDEYFLINDNDNVIITDRTLFQRLEKSFIDKFNLKKSNDLTMNEFFKEIRRNNNLILLNNNTFLLKNASFKSLILQDYLTVYNFYQSNKLGFYFFSSYFTLQKFITKRSNKTPYFLELYKHNEMQNNTPNILEPRKDVIYFQIGQGIVKIQNIDMSEKDFTGFINNFFSVFDKCFQEKTIDEIFQNEEFDALA